MNWTFKLLALSIARFGAIASGFLALGASHVAIAPQIVPDDLVKTSEAYKRQVIMFH